MEDLQAAAGDPVAFTTCDVENAIENINSKRGDAVPCLPTRCAISPTNFFAMNFLRG
jgi:hypothetical protein